MGIWDHNLGIVLGAPTVNVFFSSSNVEGSAQILTAGSSQNRTSLRLSRLRGKVESGVSFLFELLFRPVCCSCRSKESTNTSSSLKRAASGKCGTFKASNPKLNTVLDLTRVLCFNFWLFRILRF